MRFASFILLIFFLLSVASCDLINPSEKTPTYIHIDSFKFENMPNTGTQSNKITSVWVYYNNNPIGTYDLPANIPILEDKPGTLLFTPGVLYSGISDVVIPYPYYQSDTATFAPNPGNQVTYIPTTKYFPDSLLALTMEDFESGNGFIQLQGDTIKRTSDPNFVFDGHYGAVIQLNDSTISENLMSQTFRGPTTSANKTQVYLELNYKGTLPFEVGVQTSPGGQTVGSYIYGFRPKSDWNKVYIGLQDFLSVYPGQTYRIMVRVTKETSGPGYVAFDNFKVISNK